MKIITAINAHKVLVAPVVLALMWRYGNWSTEAFVYLAIHGTYALCWLVKSAAFPDRRFEEEKPFLVGVLFVFVPLASYYAAPYLLISRYIEQPPWRLGLVLFLFTAGLFLHFVSDAQKHYTLRIRPGLIDDGLFARTRNPNYLGEILIYTAFATMAAHWLPFLVLACWVFGFFLRNMLAKDRSLARHPGFDDYRRRAGLLLPKLKPARAPARRGVDLARRRSTSG